MRSKKYRSELQKFRNKVKPRPKCGERKDLLTIQTIQTVKYGGGASVMA